MASPASARGVRARATARAAAVAAALACAALACAQSLKIPDFRQSPPEVVSGPRPGEPCEQCGVIRSIRETQSTRPVAVPKTFQSSPMDQPGSTMLVGAVIVLPMGGSDQRYVGGVGTPEMRERFTETSYEIIVRLDNGGYTAVQRSDGASFRVGDRVRVQGNQLSLLSQ